MSKHIFTVVVECEDSDEYEAAVNGISAYGEITDEESDFKS